MRIWEFAKTNGFVVVSRDADFYERSLVEGAPPKIIWLNCGNNSTEFMTELLLNNADVIESWLVDADRSCLELS